MTRPLWCSDLLEISLIFISFPYTLLRSGPMSPMKHWKTVPSSFIVCFELRNHVRHAKCFSNTAAKKSKAFRFVFAFLSINHHYLQKKRNLNANCMIVNRRNRYTINLICWNFWKKTTCLEKSTFFMTLKKTLVLIPFVMPTSWRFSPAPFLETSMSAAKAARQEE